MKKLTEYKRMGLDFLLNFNWWKPKKEGKKKGTIQILVSVALLAYY